jgi:uncharacterized protein
MPFVWFVPLLFFVIAFIFSMLGMGGSQLYIPILFWAGLDFKTEAIPLGMLLNVINSVSAATIYGIRGMIAWRTALPLAIIMLAFAPLGAWMNVKMPEALLLILFALFTIVAAVLMLSGWRPPQQNMAPVAHTAIRLTGGGLIGFLAGLIGRGGGSLVVPLLFMSGMEAKVAAATSAFVVSCAGISSFTSHIATAAQPEWTLWIACAVCVFVGSQLGSRVMADKLRPREMRRIFGFVLLGVAALIVIKDVLLT